MTNSTPADRARRSEAVLEVIASLRPPLMDTFKATDLYGRMRPERPRFKAAWEGFEDMEPRSILHTLDRLECEGRIKRAKRSDGRLRRDRVYVLPAAAREGEAA